MAAGAAFASIPCAALFLFVGGKHAALAAYLPYILLVGAYNGPLFALNQGVAKPRMRAMSAAIHLITVSPIGGRLGPWLVGRMNDAMRVQYGEEGIRYSLLAAIVVGSTLAGIFYLLTSLTLRRDLAAALEDLGSVP